MLGKGLPVAPETSHGCFSLNRTFHAPCTYRIWQLNQTATIPIRPVSYQIPHRLRGKRFRDCGASPLFPTGLFVPAIGLGQVLGFRAWRLYLLLPETLPH